MMIYFSRSCVRAFLPKSLHTRLFKSQNGLHSCFKGPILTNVRRCSSFEGTHGNNPSNVREIELPVPYGKLAGKAWGSEKATPVLALHGWLDNCGTFDRLIPFLSDQFYVVAIDAPGHGKSSHLPPGALYTDTSLVLDFRKAVDGLGWKKFHLLGHSMGASLSYMFSAFFPEMVDKFVSLDIIRTFSVPADQVSSVKKSAAHHLLQLEKKLINPPPVYSAESVLARLLKEMHNEVTEESAKTLLKRALKPSDCGTGVVFRHDLRCHPLRHINAPSHEVVNSYMNHFKGKLLVIMANSTHRFYQVETPEVVEQTAALYRKSLKHFVYERVEGNHFVHLNNPERVAPIINKFLLEY